METSFYRVFIQRFNSFLFFADKSCAFEIQFDAELWRGSSRIRSNEACICGSVGHQPDHSWGQVALLEPKVARNPCVSSARYKVLITRYITIAFVYCNRYRGPNDDVSVHELNESVNTLLNRDFGYYRPSIILLYLIKKYIFFSHALSTPFPSQDRLFLDYIQDILRHSEKRDFYTYTKKKIDIEDNLFFKYKYMTVEFLLIINFDL